MKTQSAVIVLAAGKGSRFEGGDHKLSQRLGAATVLGATLRHAIASHLEVVVVTTQPFADLARRSVAARIQSCAGRSKCTNTHRAAAKVAAR